MPHFILTYCPAGSGKGFIRDKYLSYLQMNPNYRGLYFNSDNTFEANIDSYVENDELYIRKSIEATEEFISACRFPVFASLVFICCLK